MRTFAIDIGGTKFTVAAFDGDKLVLRESRTTDRNGKPVDVGQPMPMGDDGKMLMAVPNKPLAAGTYKVKWHAVAPDGKPLEGEFSFTAQ